MFVDRETKKGEGDFYNKARVSPMGHHSAGKENGRSSSGLSGLDGLAPHAGCSSVQHIALFLHHKFEEESGLTLA